METHRTENNIKNHWNCSVKKRLKQFPSNLFSGVINSCRHEYNFFNQSNTMAESCITFQIKEAEKSPQRDSLELTLGLMNWRNTPSSTSSLRGEESVSSSVESDWSRLNGKAEIFHWTTYSTINHHMLITSPYVKVSESVETPQSSNNDNVCVKEVKEMKERLRMAASTFNTPSIISKRSSPASGLKRLRQKDDTPFQIDARSHMSSEEKQSISSKYRRNTCSGSKPLERRLDFDFL